MKTLQIFDGAPLPLDWLTLNTCVYGVSGSGKSTFTRRAAERVYLAGERFCAIDPKGDWYGMKSSRDGKEDGIPVVIFGGRHGDFPLEKEAGAALGEAIAKRPQSTILDLSIMRPFDRPFLLGRFFEALFHHNADPILLINDEAQDYVPQAGRSGRGDDDDVRRCLGAAIVIAKQGRQRGIGRVYLTQRAPGLHTEVREIAEVVAAFRTTGKTDKDRISEWLGSMLDGDELRNAVRSLPGLADGECLFACSNKLLRQVGTRTVLAPETFDSSRTPRIGERRREPAKLSAPDRAAFAEALKATVAHQKASDPDLLRRRIAELEAHLAERPKAEPERVEVPCTDMTVVSAITGGRLNLVEARKHLDSAIAAIGDALSYAERRPAPTVAAVALTPDGRRYSLGAPPESVQPRPALTLREKASQARQHPQAAAAPRRTTGLKPTLERRIMTVLAQFRGTGMTRDRLALHLGMHPNTKSLTNAVGALRSGGLVDGLEITDEGLSWLGKFEKLPTGRALFRWWIDEKLADREGLVLSTIAQREDWTREDLAAELGVHPNTKSFTNTIGKLRGLGLVDGLRISGELIG